MAKSRKSIKAAVAANVAKPRRRRTFRTVTRRAPRPNPPLMMDIFEYALPGFGGFAATKFVTCTASSQIAKRFPNYAKHAGGLASVASFLAAWYFGAKVKFLARYHTPIVVGSAIAALQNLVQIYFPDKLAWIVGSPKQAAQAAFAQAVTTQQAQMQAAQASQDALPDHLEEVNEDPRWYTFNDAYDAGRYKQNAMHQTQVPSNQATVPDDDGAPLPIDDGDEDLAKGVFANNSLVGN